MTMSQALSLARDESGRLRKAAGRCAAVAVLLLPIALSYTTSSPPAASRRDSAIVQVIEVGATARRRDE